MKGVDKIPQSKDTANESHMIGKIQTPPQTKLNPLCLIQKNKTDTNSVGGLQYKPKTELTVWCVALVCRLRKKNAHLCSKALPCGLQRGMLHFQ